MKNPSRGRCFHGVWVLVLIAAVVQPARGQQPPSTPLPPPAPFCQISPPAPQPALPTEPPAASIEFPSGEPVPEKQVAESAAEKHLLSFQASWDNGLQFETENHQFRFHFGGIGQVDNVWLIGPHSLFEAPGGSSSNGVGNAEATLLRRTIFEADGTLFDRVDFMIQYDFANASNENSGVQPPSFGNLTSSPAPLNIWMQLHDVPWLGNVRAGNQVKTIGMENNTSGAFLPFMERSDNNDAFYGPFDNGFSLGLTAQNWSESERLTWRYGIFQPATNVFGVALNKYTLGFRVTALPWYEESGDRLVHLGLGYWGGEIVQDELRDRVRPLLRNGPGFAVPVLADTSQVPGSKQYTVGPEFAMVLGPVTIQAEYAGQWLLDAIAPDGVDQGTVFYHGGYAEVLYFLTGEHQDYDRREGVFGRVTPLHEVRWKGGDGCRTCGAWQAGIRFSYIDLNDKGIQGGMLYDWTLGLNWFLNPNAKVQFNYIAEHRTDTPGVPEGWINGFGSRVAFDF